MALVQGGSFGGSGDKTVVEKTGTSTSTVTQLEDESGVAGVVTVEQSAGEIQLQGTIADYTKVTGGQLVVAPTSTVLRSVGALSIMRHQSFAFLDSFAGGSIDPLWAQNARGDTITQTGDVLRFAFTTAADARWTSTLRNNPDATAKPAFSIWTAVVHVKTITFTTPSSVGNPTYVAGGIGIHINSDNCAAIARYRQSTGADTLKFLNIRPGPGSGSEYATISLSQNTDLWFMIRRLGSQTSAYYRTTAPTQDDDVFTLLGSTSTDFNGDLLLGCWEWESLQNDQDGAVTIDFERVDVYPYFGPG